MTLLTFNEIKGLNEEQIENEIINIKKTLLDLRIKQVTKQPVKPHLFKLYRRQLAKILTLRTISK